MKKVIYINDKLINESQFVPFTAVWTIDDLSRCTSKFNWSRQFKRQIAIAA